ncbi:hypothetical protein [Gordonia polyisoprenivorans]|uniref:hypothetical protein n=1 Tax=Gordonia polyisoprenivorans TaxID=84595 RepID=UPI001EE661DD|nr:hypothetical protein [Gordonia polyisoprenivorans]
MSEPTTTWRRRPGRGWLAGAATLVVIVVAVATTLVFTLGREDSSPSTPAETVSAFLRAVADDDGAAALALMTEPPVARVPDVRRVGAGARRRRDHRRLRTRARFG